MSSPAADPRARRLRTAVTGAAFALVYLYAFPYFAGLKSANELPRVLTTQELVERGTIAIDARLGECSGATPEQPITQSCEDVPLVVGVSTRRDRDCGGVRRERIDAVNPGSDRCGCVCRSRVRR